MVRHQIDAVSVRAKGVCQEMYYSQSSSVYLMVIIATRIYAMISLDAVTLPSTIISQVICQDF